MTIMTTTTSISGYGRLPTWKAAVLLLVLATSSCAWPTCDAFVPSGGWAGSRRIAGPRLVGSGVGPLARWESSAGAAAVRRRQRWRCSTIVPFMGERWMDKDNTVEDGTAWLAWLEQCEEIGLCCLQVYNRSSDDVVVQSCQVLRV